MKRAEGVAKRQVVGRTQQPLVQRFHFFGISCLEAAKTVKMA
jgi:hypothetical protein